MSTISRPVWMLGWVSLLTDAATEMIYPLLPVYLSRVLGAGALALGVIEGVAEGTNSVLKMASGWLSDRQPRRKPLVIVGYAISSLARPLIAFTTTWGQVLAIRVLDRTGKGIRGAPRDAMLAGLAAPEARGRVFGFHRAMDHTGAVIGPLVATGVLFFMPGEYRALFLLTAIPGALAVATLAFVPEKTTAPPRPRVPRPALSSVPLVELSPDSPRLPRQLFLVLAVLLVFSLGSSADAFLLLRLSEVLGGATYVPLLWAAIHVVKASLSTWGGALSDRLGRKTVIVMGWGVYALVYLGFAVSTSGTAFTLWFLVYGLYYALTEGAEKALVADLAPESLRGTAFGYYNAVLGVGTVTASVTFGFLYERFGSPVAFGTGAGLAALAAVLLMLVSTVVPGDRREVGQ